MEAGVEPGQADHDRRIVVTGAGACVPGGPTLAEAIAGGSPEPRDDVDDAVPGVSVLPVHPFDPRSVVDRKKALKLMGPNIQFALGAAREAWQSSGREAREGDAAQAGSILGARVRLGDYPEMIRTAQGSLVDGKMSMAAFSDQGIRGLYPLSMLRNLPNLVTAQVSIQLGLKGYSDSLTSGDTSGLEAIGEARDVIARGDAEVVLCGGADDLLDPISMGILGAHGWLRPGGRLIPSQGAGMLVLEELEYARRRGAKIQAEVLATDYGYVPPEDPEALPTFLKRVLSRACVDSSDVLRVATDCFQVLELSERVEAVLGTLFPDPGDRPERIDRSRSGGYMGAAGGAVEAALAVGSRGRGPAAEESGGWGTRVSTASGRGVDLVLSASINGPVAALVLGPPPEVS